MKGQTSLGFRIFILIYAVLYALYGLLHVVSPALMQAVDPAVERVLGGAIVVFAVGAAFAFFEKAWERVKLLIIALIGWMVVYVLTMAWGIITGEMIVDAWVPTAVGAVFTILLGFFYLREVRLRKAI